MEEYLILSYSRMSSFLQCAKRCKEEKFSKGPQAVVGDIFHEAMKLFHKNKRPESEALIGQKIIENGLTRADADDLKKMYQDTISARMDVSQDRIITVESEDGEEEMYGKKFFLVPLPLVVECADGTKKRVVLRGAFDLVYKGDTLDKGIFIRDYKTGFLEADDFQADLYALAAFLKYWRISPISTQFVYARKGFSSRTVRYTESELTSVLEYVALVASAYAKETKWNARFNELCGTCTLRNGCDVYHENISKIPAIQEIDPENWNAIQAWKEHLSALAKVSKQFLDDVSDKERDYIRKYGPQAIGNGTKELIVSEETARYDIPTMGVMSILQQNGIDPIEALEFSSSKIDRLLLDSQIKGIISKERRDKITEEIDNLKTVKSSKFVVRAKPIAK